MKKRLTALCLTAAAALGLCGCGRVFDTEYVVETSYEPVLSAAAPAYGDANVGSFDELKRLLLDMVAEGTVVRSLRFAPAYEGDVHADLASACWQIRTQDALCAYCVENIAYDLSKIVNRYEAVVTVAYSKTAADRERIIVLPYTAEAAEPLREAVRTGQTLLVLLIERSSYSAEEMEEYIRELYRENPALAPQEPAVKVEMLSGAETQRLYEISFDYGLDPETLAARRAALMGRALFADVDTAALSQPERALLACSALLECCRATDDPAAGSVYDALVGGRANSRGMALGYIELCRQLKLSCRLVEGQRNRVDHCWTIVELDGDFYHVDPAVCSQQGLEAAFLLSDEDAWGAWRWDYFSYPNCVGPLRADALLSADSEAEESFLPEEEISP